MRGCSCRSHSISRVISPGVYRSDSCTSCAPVAVEATAYIDVTVRAGIESPNTIPGTTEERDAEGIESQKWTRVCATACAAIGNVAVGLVINDFALEQAADRVIGKVTKFVGAHGQVRGKRCSILVRHMLTNELANIHPHLFVRLEGLLQVVSLGPLIIEDGEGLFYLPELTRSKRAVFTERFVGPSGFICS